MAIRHKYAGGKFTVKELATRFGLRRDTLSKAIKRYGSVHKAVSLCRTQYTRGKRGEARLDQMGTFPAAVKHRSWLGCSFSVRNSDGVTRSHWIVIDKKDKTTVIAECNESPGVPDLVGTWREFDPEDTVITTYLPTKDEIEAATKEIRNGWSEKEEAERRVESFRKISVILLRISANGSERR